MDNNRTYATSKEEMLAEITKMGYGIEPWDKMPPAVPGVPDAIRETLRDITPFGWSVHLPNGYIADISTTGEDERNNVFEVALMDEKYNIIQDSLYADGIANGLRPYEVVDCIKEIAVLPVKDEEKTIEEMQQDMNDMRDEADRIMGFVQSEILYMRDNITELSLKEIESNMQKLSIKMDEAHHLNREAQDVAKKIVDKLQNTLEKEENEKTTVRDNSAR